MTAGSDQTQTFLEVLITKLEEATGYNKQDQDRPAAVLWPDKERQWAALMPRLGERLPLFTLGRYAPDERVGPAYWLRCIIAGTIPDPRLGNDRVAVLYLPGFSRQEIRAVETCPPELQPLAELQYRGVLWKQRNGRDWTIAAFLQSEDGGLGIEVAADAATRDALMQALLTLADEPVDQIRREAPIRAPFLYGLLHPDEEKSVLQWLNSPQRFQAGLSADEWAGFVSLCQTRYGFHPEKDGPITAARLLGQGAGVWKTVWQRFAEAPASYAALPAALRQARPTQQLSLLDQAEAWPQDNEAAETALRKALTDLTSLDPNGARRAILDLERDHARRRAWVWARFGKAPLASALGHLASLAAETTQQLGGSSVSEVAASYADHGWRADLALLDALACIESNEDLTGIRSAAQSIYRPWLDGCADLFQRMAAVSETAERYRASTPPVTEPGTCVLFADGLRFDLAQRLRDSLGGRSLDCSLEGGLAAIPTVTGTAKPSISPAASMFIGGRSMGIDPVLEASGTRVTIEVLRKALATMDIQVLKGEDDLGDPSGRGWTELGAIDAYGHEHGWRLAHHIAGELRSIERRIVALLDHGWRCVLVLTDHGWLLLPGGLPKVELPEHLTDLRKGRCARLKVGAATDQQVVPWRWDPSVRIAIAPGIHCYEAGKEYEHGGLSPQECVVPILTVTRSGAPTVKNHIESVTWHGLRCTVVVGGAEVGLLVDLRIRPQDSSSSLADRPKQLDPDGAATLFITHDEAEGKDAFIVLLDAIGLVRGQADAVVGASR